MKQLQKHLATFLTTNNSWILVVALIVNSFMRIMTFRAEAGQSMVYLNRYKWELFARMSGAMLLTFLPAIIFCFFREEIRRGVGKIGLNILWFIAFVVSPFCIGQFDLTQYYFPVQFQSEVVWIIGAVLIFIEFISSPNSLITIRLPKWKYIKQYLSYEFIVILIYLGMVTYFSFNVYNAQTGISPSTFHRISFSYPEIWIQTFAFFLIVYCFYLVNHYFLVNKVYRTKGLVYYVFGFLGLMCVFYIPFVLLQNYMPLYNEFNRYLLGKYWIGEDSPLAFWAYYSGSLTDPMIKTIPIIILIQWFKQTNHINELQKEKSQTELDLLKQQINPHFFFNTLNNVYSMSLTKDKNTSEGILQLSDLMRYVIYKGQEETVAISEEIQYLEDFIELQKLRIHKKLDIRFDKDIEKDSFQVAPLLFITLIENAFKHGIENTEEDSYLYIGLEQKGGIVKLICDNSLDNNLESEPGVGLKNLKRRLELLYPGNHKLSFDKRENSYMAEMQINTQTNN